MADSIAKRSRAVTVAIIALVEQIGVWFAFAASDIGGRPDWRGDDMVARIGPVHIVLYAIILTNGVFAYALYAYSRRVSADLWSGVWWVGLAMSISPWTTFLLIGLPLPDLVPWQAAVLLGIAGPYALIAARLRRSRQPGA